MKTFTHFAILSAAGLCEPCLRAARKEIRECERALRQYDEHIEVALARPQLSGRSKRFLKRWWYGDPCGQALSLGNRAVHQAAMIASIATLMMLAHADRTARKGKQRFRMLTTTPDLGVTGSDAPVLNLAAIRRNFYVAAVRARVDALGFIDLAVVDERTSLEPVCLSAHMHGAARAKDKGFLIGDASRAALPVKNPTNRFGLKAVKITSKGRDWPGMKRCHVARLGYYIRKVTCGLKVPFTNKEGRRRTKTTLQGWRLVHALRQLECWSHCDALETTVGVGAGRRWRARWKALMLRLLGSETAARGLEIDHVGLEREWARIWAELGAPGLKAVRIIR